MMVIFVSWSFLHIATYCFRHFERIMLGIIIDHWQSQEAGAKARMSQELEELKQQQFYLQRELTEARDDCSVLVSSYCTPLYVSVIGVELYDCIALLLNFRKWMSVGSERRRQT